jgi:hypothetical protein
MGGFFSALFKGDSKFDWLPTIVSSIFGPFGHLYLRVAYLNGSLDKMWLFLLGSIPPFSFLANVAMKHGYVNMGPGTNVIDRWVLVPIIFKFVLALVLFLAGKSSSLLFMILSFILELGSIMIPNLIRIYDNCNKKLISDSYLKALVDSYVAYGFSNLFPILFSIIPIFRILNMVLDYIPGASSIMSDILWCLGFVCTYTFINMMNQDNMKIYCENPNDDKTKLYASCIISTILIIGTIVKNQISAAKDMISDFGEDMMTNMGEDE